MLGGLMNGTFGVGDLRREAIHARDQIKELSDELGPEATTGLQGYLGILNRSSTKAGPPICQDAARQDRAATRRPKRHRFNRCQANPHRRSPLRPRARSRSSSYCPLWRLKSGS